MTEERLDPDEGEIFRAGLAAVREAGDRARELAPTPVRDKAFNPGLWSSAAIKRAEARERRRLAALPIEKQVRTVYAAVRALHGSMAAEGFARRRLSVMPHELLSGRHVGDVLHRIGQHPRLWRLIVFEGVAAGAFVFATRGPFVAITVNRRWDGRFIDRTSEEERRACEAVMASPYPVLLPSNPPMVAKDFRP